MAGRQSKDKWIEKNIEQIKEWKKLGATDKQICKQLRISESAYYNNLNKNPKLKEEIQVGIDSFIFELIGELARKAKPHNLKTRKVYKKIDEKTGHMTKYEEITYKEVDGDTGALHLLLKNIYRENWADNWQTLELKKKELELREKIAEDKLF